MIPSDLAFMVEHLKYELMIIFECLNLLLNSF